MPPKRQLTRMFPHKVILITSLVLCACAACTGVLSALSWTNQLWGYYFRTGIWCGAVILITGILGIVSNYVQSVAAVKTFLISAIFGVLVSLALIALSAGGLDVESGFYRGKQENVFLNNICHGVSLGVGVLQLTLCILCDGICIYYLFIDNSQMYKLDNDSKLKLISQKKNTRSSTRSDTVLVGNSAKPKSSKKSKKKQKSTAEDQGYEVEYRKPSRHLAGQTTSPNRSPCVRPSSFSTFGHGDGGDRASLIVHPGDAHSIADTNRSQTPNVMSGDECHYAQTPLFDPPLPIEEDEELPPYHVVDPYSSVSVSSQPSVNSKRPNRQPSKKENRIDQQTAMASVSSRTVTHAQNENIVPNTSFLKDASQHSAGKKSGPMRHSLSADLLSIEGPSLMDQQGVSCRDFGQLNDKILIDTPVIKGRSNSFRTNRNKRLDRRKRALSAEIRVSKEHILEQGLGHRTSSIDGSNTGLFASNRIIPTKFSLRTPVRQIGMPHVRSAIPVKSVSTPPLISPPPKPPRTFSVKAEDFKVLSRKPEDIDDNILKKSETSNNDDKSQVVSNNTIEIEKGPVLKYDKDTKDVKSCRELETSGAILKTDKDDRDTFQPVDAERAVIELSVSPTVKCPTENVQKPSDPSTIYAKVNKHKNNQGVALPESQTYNYVDDKSSFETTQSKTAGNTEETLVKQNITKDTSNESKIKLEKEKEPEKLSNEIERHHNLQVRIPPLSPSERILRKRADLQSTEPVLASFSQSKKIGLVNSNNVTSTEKSGARPKTVLQKRVNDSYASPVPKPRKSVQENSNVSASGSMRNKASVQQMRNTSKFVGSTGLSEKSKPQINESNRHPNSTLNNVPNRSGSGSHMSASSQGVLHLPQSQHNRQIQPARQGYSAMPSHGDLANQNHQDMDTDGANALYAKLL